MKDITGQRFGRLVAVRFMYYDDKYRDHWQFRCDCGQEKVMPAANVKWGHVQSCGCMRRERMKQFQREDIAGQRFGRLTAVRPTGQRDASGSIVWECRCDCGNTVLHSVNSLKKGHTQSCGCLFQESRRECTSYRRDIKDQTNLSTLISAKKPRSDNQSGYTGVYQNKKTGKWIAQIIFQKKRYRLGTFRNREAAIQARQNAERNLHDPVIRENWVRLTDNSRDKYLQYLQRETTEQTE